jgi:hypothetical protein
MVVQSNAYVCSRFTATKAGSNPADGSDVRLLSLLCVVQVAASAPGWPLVQSICNRVCVRVCVCVWSEGPISAVAPQKKIYVLRNVGARVSAHNFYTNASENFLYTSLHGVTF